MSTVRIPLPLLLALAACNQPPTGTTVSIAPRSPFTTDDLVATVGAGDPDGDPVLTRVRWTVDGVDVPDLDGSDRVPAGLTHKGQTWAVDVTPTDGRTFGPDAVAAVTVIDSPPTASVAVSTGGGLAGKPLQARARADDADADDVTLAWAWTVDGEDAGIDGPTVPGDRVARGQTWSVTVTPFDGEVEGEPATAVAFVGNTPPAVIAVDVAPDAPTAATDLHAAAEVADADGDAVEVRWRWRVGEVELAEATDTLGAGWFARGDMVTVTAVPTDGRDDGRGVSATVVVGNAAPTVAAAVLDPDAPVAGAPIACAPSGYADADGDPDASLVSFAVDGAPVDGDVLPAGAFAKGDVVTCTVVPFDGLDAGSPVSTSVVIPDSAPTVASAAITPDVAYLGDVLSVRVDGAADADGDEIAFEVTWTVDGEIAGFGATFSAFEHGDVVAAIVVPTDGERDGVAVHAAPVVIANSPPSVTSARVTPGEIREGDVVTCAGVGWTDADGDAPAPLIVWTVGDRVVDRPTLTGADFDRGDRVTCHLTPFDGFEPGVVVSSDGIEVQNTAPVLSGIDLDPAAPAPGDTVRVVLGDTFDPDGDDVTTTFEWTVDGEPAGTAATLTGFRSGAVIAVRVTPTDGLEDGPPVSASTTAQVVDSAPIVTAVSITPGAPTTTSTLTAGYSASDPDDDPLTASFAWTVNGLPAGDADTLPGTAFARGDVVAVTVTVTDGVLESDPVTSAPVDVLDAPPTVAGATLPSSLAEGDVATCAPIGLADVDDDPVDVLVAWYVDGEIVATSETLSSASFSHGDAVWCELTPYDGFEAGVAVSSATVVVADTPPRLASVSILPAAPTVRSVLYATVAGAFDADGDEITLEYRWTVNDSLAGVGPTFSDAFARGDLVALEVTPVAGGVAGEPVPSDGIGISDAAPVLVDVQLVPGVLRTDSVATVQADVSDADGDPTHVHYAWTVNGEPAGTDAPVLDGAVWFDRGDEVACHVTTDDGAVVGTPADLGPFVVANSEPTSPTISFVPGFPTDDDDLVCTVVTPSTDADGDALVTTIRLVRNDLPFDEVTGASATVLAEDTAPFDDFTCVVTVTDGIAETWPVDESVALDPRWILTTCGSTGPTGPDATACDLAYAGTAAQGVVTVVDGAQQFEIPATGTWRIAAYGAQGGGAAGGPGALVQADFALTAGEVLTVVVGQRGGSGDPDDAAGGGGATWVYADAFDPTPLVVAAGGGGQGQGAAGGPGSASLQPAAGGGSGSGGPGLSGSGGAGGDAADAYAAGGGGAGWLDAGGDGEPGAVSGGLGGLPPRDGATGGLYDHPMATGADGGFGGGGAAGDTGAGGGGAGYDGGGGGNGFDGASWGGGAGGGSFVAPWYLVDTQQAIGGVVHGGGIVVLTRLD